MSLPLSINDPTVYTDDNAVRIKLVFVQKITLILRKIIKNCKPRNRIDGLESSWSKSVITSASVDL